MSGKSYKLKYFPITALGEPIRWILSYADKQFEDIRISKEQWPAVKPTTPFGKMPVLEVDGKQLHQTKPILRYLAKSVNLSGANDWENLQIDIAADTVDDLRSALALYYYDTNESSKEEKKGPLFNETIPFYLERLDALVKANGGYFANGKLSWADIYFASLVQYMSGMAGVDNLIAKHANLQALHDKVVALPKIAAWIAKRPHSDI